MPDTPIDPLTGPRYVLEGRVVTMDDDFAVFERGKIFVDSGEIKSAQDASAPHPPEFADTKVIRTGDTIYPGLIERHNHLSYNVLPLWDVPETFANNAQWQRRPAYKKAVTKPMKALALSPDMPAAIVRYVECKCLLSGITTSQGITLQSDQGIKRHYRGYVRNVEDTNDPTLPEARTRIADVHNRDAAAFLRRQSQTDCLLLHLSEGVNATARKHFLALQLASGEWAITPSLAGIHSPALQAEDFRIMGEHGAAMVWSPLSNLLLYGGTANIRAARDSGLRIGLGSDWSPSGSKNLLGELKAAHLISQENGGVFDARELVAMATRNAAQILRWDAVMGSIETGQASKEQI